MQALLYAAHGSMVISDETIPHPSRDELLIKVAHVGICGSELEGFASRSPRRAPPLTMGHEFSGVVAEVGADVKAVRVANRVAINPLLTCGRCEMCQRGASNVCRNRQLIGLRHPGAFAEYVVAPESAAIVVDDTFPLSHGAMVEPLANVVHATSICGSAILGASVLVMGAGTIGLCCLQVALVAGATLVAVVDVDDARLAPAKAFGANVTINGRSDDVGAIASDVTNGRGFDLVFDAVGRQETRLSGIEALGPLGTAVWIGTGTDSVTMRGNAIVHEERRIQGSYGYTAIDFARSFALIASGKIELDSWMQQFPLSEGVDVFLGLLSNKRPGLIKAQLCP